MKCLQFGGECNHQCQTYPCNTLRGYEKGIAEVIEIIKEIYKNQYYCMADMCETDDPTVDACVECFCEAIIKSIALKDQNK